jgi:hypothetical protein
MEMSNLFDYVLHYNHFDKNWNAIPRDKYNEYWSNRKVDGVLKSKEIKTLIELITRGDDFIKTIK